MTSKSFHLSGNPVEQGAAAPPAASAAQLLPPHNATGNPGQSQGCCSCSGGRTCARNASGGTKSRRRELVTVPPPVGSQVCPSVLSLCPSAAQSSAGEGPARPRSSRPSPTPGSSRGLLGPSKALKGCDGLFLINQDGIPMQWCFL